jgi:hypothetical protein
MAFMAALDLGAAVTVSAAVSVNSSPTNNRFLKSIISYGCLLCLASVSLAR